MTSGADGYGWETGHVPQSCGYLSPAVIGILKRHSHPGISVCDVGSGNGVLVGDLIHAGYRAVGIECDSEGVQIACRAYPGVPFYNLGVQDDPAVVTSEQGKFEAVISTEVVEHLFSPRLLPRFAGGLLIDGGLLVISTPYHGYLKNFALSLMNKWDFHHTALWDGGHIKFWSRATLTSLLESEGFKVIAFEGVGRLPWLWKSMIVVAKRL